MITKKRKRKHSEADKESAVKFDDPPLEGLPMQVLRKYKKSFKIHTRQCVQKPQLVEILMKHFLAMPVSEKEIIAFFIYMVKQKKNKVDFKDNGTAAHLFLPAETKESKSLAEKKP